MRIPQIELKKPDEIFIWNPPIGSIGVQKIVLKKVP